jgi:hypothetical protein
MHKIIAALLAVALIFTAASPAFAGYGRGKHYGGGHYKPYRYGGHYKPYRYGGNFYKYRHYKPYYGYGGRYRYGRHTRYRGHRDYGYGYAVLGALAGAVALGGLLARPAYYPPPARPAYYPSALPVPPGLSGCLPTTGTGLYYGRPAQFGGTMCYNRFGQGYVLDGSVRFLG